MFPAEKYWNGKSTLLQRIFILHVFNQSQKFQYLGRVTIVERRCDAKIRRCIGIVKDPFQSIPKKKYLVRNKEKRTGFLSAFNTVNIGNILIDEKVISVNRIVFL